MTVLVTLTAPGADLGPFNLYSDLDGYVTPFATGITKASLEAGVSFNNVPDYTEIIRVKSTGACTNYIDITCTLESNLFGLAVGNSCTEACDNFDSARRNDFFNLL